MIVIVICSSVFNNCFELKISGNQGFVLDTTAGLAMYHRITDGAEGRHYSLDASTVATAESVTNLFCSSLEDFHCMWIVDQFN